MFLSKLLPLFVYPLGAALVASAMALVLMLSPYRNSGRFLLAATLASLWVCSTPLFANWLAGRLEAKHPPVAVDALAPADAIILLGGMLGQPIAPRLQPDLTDAADRAIHAVALYRAGKAPRIVVSGGNLPWQTAKAPEADLIAALLAQLGVPKTAIVRETASRTTHENAVDTAVIYRAQGWRTGLLVTSAAHMDRALAAFRAAGLAVTPATTDVRVTYPYYETALDLLPDAEALARTSAALKEYLGIRVYRFRGWASVPFSPGEKVAAKQPDEGLGR